MTDFVAGQRWRSEMEPELGVGIVDAVDGRRIHMRFPQGDLERIYAAGSAPLQRVAFHPGDRVADENGASLTIASVENEAGLLVYCGDGRRLREDRLAGAMVLDAPKDRLMAGQREPSGLFDLRHRILAARSRTVRSAAHGFVGGRVDLIPHQFAIAAEVCGRRAPRVLLADETGLGKTIEAGLILHRLSAIGRISRILVVVPDALVVQWFVELARRFNLQFRIFGDDTIRDWKAGGAGQNPFDDEPLGLCGFSFLADAPDDVRTRVIRGGWDMVVVDEAHHMQPGDALFDVVRRLSEIVPGLILITATPGHLAARSHFARLQLIDPLRYPDYRQFRRESESFSRIAGLVALLDAQDPLPEATVPALTTLLALPENDVLAKTTDAAGRRDLLQRLIDRHGTGRVMFRTTRLTVTGFPGRKAHPVPLDAGDDPALLQRLNQDWLEAFGRSAKDRAPSLDDDPRVDWLEAFLRAHREEKILLICRTVHMVNALYDALERRINTRIGRYHEGMTLVQRDRNAAWFAEPDGAVMLLCSEIGSEGRNFQFARHLVLFDLPVDAELLEQRIGRLDRIGQSGVVQVMVPYVRGTGGEVLARWYHEALNAFETNVPAAGWVTRRLLPALTVLVETAHLPAAAASLNRLIRCGRLAVARQQRRIDAGRDRLLALDAPQPEAVRDLMAKIQAVDVDSRFTDLAERLLDVWGISIEAIAPAVFHLAPDHRYADPLPGFRPSGMTVTTDRAVALAREDLGFLTWDHPLVTAATDKFLGHGRGNVAFGHLPASGVPEILLEMIFVLEAPARPDLPVQAFLPTTPVHVVVDHRLDDGAAHLPGGAMAAMADGPAALFRRLLPVASRLIPDMIAEGRKMAATRVRGPIDSALAGVARKMDRTIDRLETISRTRGGIDPREIDGVREEKAAIVTAIREAALRLDALRFVAKGNFP